MTESEKESLINEITSNLLAKSQDIANLRTVDTVAGLKSLPAMLDGELVLAPISKLSEEASSAATLASTAATAANSAAASARQAASDANQAAESANELTESATSTMNEVKAVLEEYTRIEEAMDETMAKTQEATTNANNASNKALTAASTATEAASYVDQAIRYTNAAADSANDAADRADVAIASMQQLTDAAASATTAANDATRYANKAAVRAETASIRAEEATAKANTAATNAQGAADTAIQKVDAAISKAEAAAANANTKATLASTAATEANNAANRVDASINAASTATEQANTAADNANTSAANANTASSNANTAAANADVATAKAEAAASKASQAATSAELASASATEAKDRANAAAERADTAADSANTAATRVEETLSEAETALSKFDQKYKAINLSLQGATARIDAIVDSVNNILDGNDSLKGTIVYSESDKVFLLKSEDTYYKNWSTADLYMNEDRTSALKDKVYILDDTMYMLDDEGKMSGASGGMGGGFYNVTSEMPLESGYYTKETAIAALANAKIKDEQKIGMIITFEYTQNKWVEYRFVSDNVSNFLIAESWEEFGGGKIKSISLNGTSIPADESGNVALTFDQIRVDESLDAESTNPVQNAIITQKINEISDATVGGVEVIPDGDKNTLNILNKQGGIIASAEFTGGGGGTGTASRIILTASMDKAQVKEGGKAMLTYSYNHVNSEGEPTGIKGDITITIKRGTTVTYEQTLSNVSADTYTLDVSEYLLVGTTEIYIKAEATTEDGTKQTKQVYTSINVITLVLASSYNLASSIANGGYTDADKIEIPFTITGSGTKDISLYIDGGEVPMSQTINKSGTVNSSFTIAASTLAAGKHSLQMVAERDGLKSDSIYIDILKAGLDKPFVGIKYTDTNGNIILGSTVKPIITAIQYEQTEFNFIAYDPNNTIATVNIYINDMLTSTINAPRTMQTYTNRFTSRGDNNLVIEIGSVRYEISISVAQSEIDLTETIYGLIAKFDAAGRSNNESNPAHWVSNDIDTTFEGFDWSSNGWTGNSLKLSNGAKATINYKPFENDIKSTGLTVEMTIKTSNINDRNAHVVSCIDNNKGLLITAENASFKTGQTVEYTNEEGEIVSREIKLGTNFTSDTWLKIALAIDTKDNNRLMHIYVNGNRTGADVYDTSFNFAQENPKNIVFDSSEADIEIRNIRIYNRAISDDEELDNYMVDSSDVETLMKLYDDNNILGETGKIDIDKLRAKGKGVLRIVRPNKLDDVYAENNKKIDFKADIYFYSPFGKEYDFVLINCNIRIQGTSSTKYPSKNIRIYFNKGGDNLSLSINGELNPFGSNKYQIRPGAIPMNLYTMKSDYSDSSMSLNTGGAKLFNDVFKELGLLTPPQRYQYENGGNSLSAINTRTSIDGFPIDMFSAETVDGESEYYGQYNFNNEKSKSEELFGQKNVEGFNPTMPMTFETLNNGEKMCLFQSSSDEEIPLIFDAALETNYPDDVKWAGMTTEQQNSIIRLFKWIRECVPADANPNDINSFTSQKFKDEIDQYFDKDFILTYYLWTDYYLAVDQRAKNMMLRTWDGLIWYITYYDGDTQMGKRNDCFLVYTYTTDRDTYDAEASKYAFEGRDSWLWNLCLANLQEDLSRCASNLRGVMTNERVIKMFNVEQVGNWSDRAYNKSGELKYITPAIQEMYGKIWPFIYALQGANTAHREYFIKNRFSLLDAKYATSNFTSDNVDMYLNRTTSDTADVIKITGSEVYAFGYGTNNSPLIGSTGIVEGGVEVSLSITRAFTVNDPIRLYGASRMVKLDMTGAADHLKNGFDLGKCEALKELNMQSSTGGSTGWWLVLNACKALRRVNVRNQQQAKTGSNTSKELDFSNQTKLEYLDARGTLVESINFAKGAPLTQAYLPASLKTLKLEYLSLLSQEGLYIEDYTSINTFIFEGCPNIDWIALLDKCTNIKNIRVTGIDMEGDGSLLSKYLLVGGIDAEGNFVNHGGFVGSYRLTRSVDNEVFNEFVKHYPELSITQPEYTMIKFDDTVSDSANISNLDNSTGYEFGNNYTPSGHIQKILNKRHRFLAKKTATGEMSVCQLHDKNSNYFADADDILMATQATLNGDMGDVMMYEPHYWYKGINDILNDVKYSLFSSLDRMPSSLHSEIINKEEISMQDGFGVRVSVDYSKLTDAVIADSDYSYGTVNVKGYKQVRFPYVISNVYGAVFVDTDGNILKRVYVPSTLIYVSNLYIFTSIPENAEFIVFTFDKSSDFDYVLLTESDKIEAIEPDWVEHTECLCGVYEGLVRDDILQSISGVGSSASISQANFKIYATNRGKGFSLIDYELHKDVGNLFFAKYGERDGQSTCGPGTHAFNKVTGASNSTGMQDTKPTAKDGDPLPQLNSGGSYYVNGNAYVLKNEDDEARTAIGSVVCMGYENWFGNKNEWMDFEFNRSIVDYIWRSKMPDGSERAIQGIKTSNTIYPKKVIHGKYMDNLTSLAGGSTSSYYYDGTYQNPYTSIVVYRSGAHAETNGGVSYVFAYNSSTIANQNIGSRLVFRGIIKKIASVSDFVNLEIKP